MNFVKPEIMIKLKEATKVWHDRLEAHPRSTVLMRPDVNVSNYIDILARSYGFYRPLEAQLMALEWDGDGFDYRSRLKHPSLEADLKAYGLSDADIAALPVCDDVPQVKSMRHAAGILYVLEGATLGGQIIKRHLGEVLGEKIHRAMAFYSSYGDRVGQMWHEFMTFAAKIAATESDHPEVLSAAIETFTSFEKWLSADLPEVAPV